MSTFNARLFLKGSSGVLGNYSLTFCTYESYRKLNNDGRPISGINSGIVTLMFRDPVDEHIIKWGMNAHDHKDGSIKFYNHEGGDLIEFQVLEFERGFCAHFKNTFSVENATGALRAMVTISCERLKIGNVDHDNKWAM
ncbi:type VI secretion system tube protein TssD [Chitinophagaceae bacterium 26-R-25]|nr:type VI secretion system tube protein TssD [Chitinophagaceae bacterium 26-R-25]